MTLIPAYDITEGPMYRIRVRCPLCHMTHHAKEHGPVFPIAAGEPELPDIKLVKVTSSGRGRIKNHASPISHYHGKSKGNSEAIEREVLTDIKSRCKKIALISDVRLREI